MNSTMFNLQSHLKSKSSHYQQSYSMREEREGVKQVLCSSKGIIWEHLIITGILSYKCADYSQAL